MKTKLLDASFISAFCMELHLVMKAGIPLSEGIALIGEDESDPEVKKILEDMHLQMELGEPIAKAAAIAGGFPNYVVEMFRIGQMTGYLESVFKALSVYYARQEDMRKSIRQAVVYPMVLLAMMLFVIVVLLTKVLPIFRSVFQQLGTDMSPVALTFMRIGQWIGSYGLVFVVVFVVLCLGLLVLSRFPKPWGQLMQWLQTATAGFGLQKQIASAHLADALVMALSSGMDINDSLDLAEKLLSNSSMVERIRKCQVLMADGFSFAEAANTTGLFLPLYCRMIAIGFKTGNLDTVMTEIAERSTTALEEDLERLIGKIEPSLVIIMSVIIGMILLSVMLPLMGIMSVIG